MKQWLSRWCLNLVYATLLLALSPVLLWQQARGSKKRSHWQQRIFGPDLSEISNHRDFEYPLLWLHAVSVGEVNLLTTLVPALKAKFPMAQFAISASTDTGLELAQLRFTDCIVFRFPVDFSWAVNRIYQQLQPAVLILTELEVWPNCINLAEANQVPVVVVNGRLSEKSFRRYQQVGFLVRNWFRSLDRVIAQTPSYAERFAALGVPQSRIEVAGSIKFDAAVTDRHNAKTIQLKTQFGLNSQQPIWLAGSTSSPEEKMACEVFARLKVDYPALKLILVPRHRERFDDVGELLETEFTQFKSLRRSAVKDNPAGNWDILLVDTIGELSAWWGLADIGMVGGSFGSRGGQSMIEPAGFGVATCFGPNTNNFRDVVDLLLTHQGAHRVNDEAELEVFVRSCLQDPDYRNQMGERAKKLVLGQSGATAKTVAAICLTLDSRKGSL